MTLTLGSEDNSMDGFLVKQSWLTGEVLDSLESCDNLWGFSSLPSLTFRGRRFVTTNNSSLLPDLENFRLPLSNKSTV